MVEDPAESGLTETCSIVKERKKKDSQTIPTLRIFVLLLYFFKIHV